MPSLAFRSALSSLSSCVVTLDERDGSDERDGRGDDVGFHVGSFRTEISCRGPRRHENRRTGGRGAAGGADAFGARADTKTGEQEAAEPQAGPTRSRPAPARKQENRKYFTLRTAV